MRNFTCIKNDLLVDAVDGAGSALIREGLGAYFYVIYYICRNLRSRDKVMEKTV